MMRGTLGAIEMRIMRWSGPCCTNPPCLIEESLYCALASFFSHWTSAASQGRPAVAMVIQGLSSPCKLPCKLCVEYSPPCVVDLCADTASPD